VGAIPQGPNPTTPSVNPTAAQEIEKASVLDKPGKFALTSSAEKSPTTRNAAASMNAAAAVTGLKPWSREWVFDGNDPISQAQSEHSKPLFGPSAEEEAQANLKALSAAISGAQG